MPYLELIKAQWKQRPLGARLCEAYSVVLADNNPGCRDLQKKSPHGPLGRKRSQTTNRVGFHGSGQHTDAPTGRAAGCTQRRAEGWVGGCIIALTFSVDPGLSRSSSLHRTTPSFKEVCRNASGSEMVFFGDSSTPSVISHVTVCSAEFMSSHNRSYSTKRPCSVFRQLAAPLTLSSVRYNRNTINPEK